MNQDEVEIGRVVDGMYEMISGPKGPRDWKNREHLFHKESRQMRTWLDENGKSTILIMGRDEYSANVQPFFDENDFYEVETARTIKVMGNMAHVWSIYEARTSPDAKDLDRRGINSIQLYKDGDGQWSIISMIWDNERPGVVAAL